MFRSPGLKIGKKEDKLSIRNSKFPEKSNKKNGQIGFDGNDLCPNSWGKKTKYGLYQEIRSF